MNNVSIIAVLTGPEISSWTLIPGLKVPLTKDTTAGVGLQGVVVTRLEG